MSILVMQTTTGTLKARAIARCSLDMPMSPAFPPTMRMTQDGDPDVNPYRVVFRYRSCPAKSGILVSSRISQEHVVCSPLNEMIFDACLEISSQPIFSRRIVSGSLELAAGGSIGFPVGPNPRIFTCGNIELHPTSLQVKTYLHADARSATALDFMFMSE